ncbi:MAG: phage holin family protein [Muribaculaceae bacterium]|nr:phage holin family protein [Muribaculaceae bacterium]
MFSTDNSRRQQLSAVIRRLVHLYINGARIDVTIRLTRLFSAAAIAFVALLLGFGIITFLSLALASFLEEYIPAWSTQLILAAIYLLVIVLLFILRKPLVLDPIARFLSRLILDNPHDNEK